MMCAESLCRGVCRWMVLLCVASAMFVVGVGCDGGEGGGGGDRSAVAVVDRGGGDGAGVVDRSSEVVVESGVVVPFGERDAVAKPAGTIRVATYNVENLFDDQDDPDLAGDLEMEKPETEREALARVIRAIDADVLALQEVESLEALLWFRDGYLSGMGYEYVTSLDAGDGRGIENSVLSRFPLRDERVWLGYELGGVHPEMYGDRPNRDAGKPIEFRRSPLRVTVDVPAAVVAERMGTDGAEVYSLTLFVVHHKSGGRASAYWRELEAEKTIGLVREFEVENPGANVLVLGDFNSRVVDRTLQLYLEAGFRDPFEGRIRSDPAIQTHASNRRIDFVLFNDAATGELAGRPFVLGTPMRPAGSDWNTTPAPEGYASDHLPVVVDLRPVDR